MQFYDKEEKALGSTFNVYVEPKIAKVIARKLLRHCKISSVDVIFSHGSHGRACPTFRWIKLPKRNCSVWVIIHEVAHLEHDYSGKRGRGKWHTKQFLTIEKRLWRWLKPRLAEIIAKEA